MRIYGRQLSAAQISPSAAYCSVGRPGTRGGKPAPRQIETDTLLCVAPRHGSARGDPLPPHGRKCFSDRLWNCLTTLCLDTGRVALNWARPSVTLQLVLGLAGWGVAHAPFPATTTTTTTRPSLHACPKCLRSGDSAWHGQRRSACCSRDWRRGLRRIEPTVRGLLGLRLVARRREWRRRLRLFGLAIPGAPLRKRACSRRRDCRRCRI